MTESKPPEYIFEITGQVTGSAGDLDTFIQKFRKTLEREFPHYELHYRVKSKDSKFLKEDFHN